MRKHFLLLFLMAILPLAGFADDLSEGKMVIPSTYYGYAPNWTVGTNEDPNPYEIKVYNKVNEKLTKDVHFTVNGFYSDADCTSSLTESQVKTKNAGTTIYVKVTGTGTYENTLIASFEIKQMPLVIKGTGGTKVYGTTADGTLFTFKNTGDGVDADAVVEKEGNQESLCGDGKAFNNPTSKITFTRASGENKGNKALTATLSGALATNYSIAQTDIMNVDANARTYYTITAKDFTVDEGENVGTVTIQINDDDLTYTGAEQHPTFTVTDKARNVVLTAGMDYTVTYVDGENNADACVIAGNHNIRFTGMGNYKTADKVQETFTIAPAIIMVKPIATKVYDGNATLPAAPANATANTTAQEATGSGCYFTFQGFVDNKTAANVTYGTEANAPAWTWNVAEDATANARTTAYDLKISNANVNAAFTLENYTFMAVKGTYTITKAPLTAKAKDDTWNYGETKTFTLVDAGSTVGSDAAFTGAIAADFAALRNAIKVTKAETAETTGANAGKFKLTPVWKTEAEIDATDLEAAAKTAAKTAIGNYDLTPAYGYLTFVKANLVIALNESAYTLTKVYDGQPISVTLDKTDNGLIITGKVNESDEVNLDNLVLNVVGSNTGAYQATPYVLKLSGATAENYNITYVASSYTITKRPLNITTFAQTMVKGEAYNLNQSAYEITNTAANEGLVDDASKVFKLTTSIAHSGTPDVITDNAGDYDIDAVDAGVTGTKWANYQVTVVKGKATVIDATTVITLADATSVTDELEAADGAAATVSFSARDLTAGVWYTLVLPFDITVSDFSKAVGYAIVDKFDETASDGKVHFNIFMGKIPANTPFMFKLDGQKNNLNQVYFAGKTIVYDPTNADEDAVQIGTDGNPFVTDNANNKLVGFYGKKTDNKLNQGEYYLNTSGVWTPAANSNVTLGSGRAKLVLAGTGSAREILVEEPDGSVTAISCIAADGMAVESNGWYTIGGVKLESAPTEKGVYIRNGKKMVIK